MRKFNKARKWLVISFSFLILLTLILFIGGMVLSARYSDLIKNELQKNLPPTISIDFTACKVNLISRSITFQNLRGSIHRNGLSNQHTFTCEKLDVSGIHVLNFFLNRKLTINQVRVDNATLAMDRLLFNDSTAKKTEIKKGKFKGLEVSEFNVDSLKFILQNDTLEEVKSTIKLRISDIYLPFNSNGFQVDDMKFIINESSVNDVFISFKQSLYEAGVKRIQFNETKTLTLDSIRIEPKYAKYAFAHKAGKQIDRLEILIPVLKINNIKTSQIKDSTFNASGIHFYSPNLSAFRDKRLPFIKDNEVPLPVALLKEIPFKINVDTIQIHNAFISYEEFPIDGDSSGTIKFRDLHASMFHFNNYDTATSRHIDLDVETKFMGSGLLKASFDLPLNDKKKYTAKGTLFDFYLPALNPMIEPLAKIRIESGHMIAMNFNFNYDEHSSIGEVELNYDNLKVLSLTEKESKTVIDKFKTFLLNTFIIPKKKNETVSANKGKGTIESSRDRKRSIFNYWWKSLFSGIKSSHGLGKKSEKD